MNDKFRNLLNEWLNCLLVENYSESSIYAYRKDIAKYLDYFDSNGLSISDIEISDMRDYVIFLSEKNGLTQSTVKRNISTVKVFMKWLVRYKHIESSPSDLIKIKRIPRRLPFITSEEDMAMLLDQPDPKLESEIWLWKRDKAMFEILYSSGLRVSELLNLKLNDVNTSTHLVRVNNGKGGKDRVVPLGSKACEAINVWLTYRIQKNPDTDFLFINHYGRHLRANQVRNRINVQAARCGIREHMHPHLFRHCFATHLLSASQNIRAVQEMLGHADINSTEIYTQVDFNSLAKAYDAAHPRSKK
jgi:integrase/recombinase XerC